MTDRPDLTTDHYLDAVALCRATLSNDETGLMALVNTIDVGMTFQALVRLHLSTLGAMANGDGRVVDQLLVEALDLFGNTTEPPC